jgi:Protein of unknown function (DUF669)
MPTYTTGHDETLPEGVYDFTVIDAHEQTSKASGNAMIELQLAITTPDGKNGPRVFDHLVFTPKAYWKIDSFRIATGEKLVEGQTAAFEPEDCLDRTGKLWLTIEKFEGRNRNKVGEYIDLAGEKNPPPAAPPAKKDPPLFADDDIPMT